MATTTTSLLDTLPEPLILETIMTFLGPLDLMQTLGSTNKRYRQLSKSDFVWRAFGSQRNHCHVLRAMIADVKRNNYLADPIPEAMYANGNNQPQQQQQQNWPTAAVARLERLCSWARSFHNDCDSYKDYKHLHEVKHWPGSRHYIGRTYCRQQPDPIIEADCLDGWASKMLSARSRRDCHCRSTVHCNWPGCGTGYCDEHTKKVEWEHEEFSPNDEKWNRCAFCRLELCRDCNNRHNDKEGRLIEPQTTPDGTRRFLCVDCRQNF